MKYWIKNSEYWVEADVEILIHQKSTKISDVKGVIILMKNEISDLFKLVSFREESKAKPAPPQHLFLV